MHFLWNIPVGRGLPGTGSSAIPDQSRGTCRDSGRPCTHGRTGGPRAHGGTGRRRAHGCTSR